MSETKTKPTIQSTIEINLSEKKTETTSNKLRVLIVDDDPAVRKILMELLSRYYTVITASTGVQLPELLQRHTPDLVILDVMLPWIDGFELCRIIKTHHQGKETPVLFLTGCQEKEDILTGQEVGCSGYLTKPFHAKQLYQEVERLLAA